MGSNDHNRVIKLNFEVLFASSKNEFISIVKYKLVVVSMYRQKVNSNNRPAGQKGRKLDPEGLETFHIIFSGSVTSLGASWCVYRNMKQFLTQTKYTSFISKPF